MWFVPCVTIPTSCGHSHLVWVTILTLCSPCITISHLTWAFSPCVHLVQPFPNHFVSTSCDHFPPCVVILTSHPPCATMSTLCDHFRPCVGILTSCDNSHIAWVFSPCVTILSLHPPRFIICALDIAKVTSIQSHLASTLCDHFPPHVGILTLCDHSHFVWVFSPCMTILTLCPPHVTIPSLCGHSHLVWPFSPYIHLVWPLPTLHGHSHLVWPFSPCVHLAFGKKHWSVTDPGFPRAGGGGQPQGGDNNLLFDHIFPEKYIQGVDPVRDAQPWYPLDLPMNDEKSKSTQDNLRSAKSCTSATKLTIAVADPGFPRGGGANPKGGGREPIIWPIFPENCMKMKKFWARGGARVPHAPP